MKRGRKLIEIPDLEVIEAELQRIREKEESRSPLRVILWVLTIAAAIGILAITLWLPFLRIYGTSMAPTLQDGEIVCCIKPTDFKTGDIVAFHYDNKLLVKRVIGRPGDWINIDESGNVSVNDIQLHEPYLAAKALGGGDVEYPYQVPDGQFFVLGDQRAEAIDSRYIAISCISKDEIVGKVFVRIWPLGRIAIVK